jgi:hypothetical protein
MLSHPLLRFIVRRLQLAMAKQNDKNIYLLSSNMSAIYNSCMLANKGAVAHLSALKEVFYSYFPEDFVLFRGS